MFVSDKLAVTCPLLHDKTSRLTKDPIACSLAPNWLVRCTQRYQIIEDFLVKWNVLGVSSGPNFGFSPTILDGTIG